VALSPEGGVNAEDEQILEVAEDNFRELVDVVASKDIITMIAEVVVVEREVAEDLAGRTTTSHNGIAMRLSTSSLTGRCWRRLISTA
jgi:hypothetical protein